MARSFLLVVRDMLRFAKICAAVALDNPEEVW